MKKYQRGHEIVRDDVARAVSAWLSGESGRKNGHRIVEEYGSVDALIDEILWEIVMRTLTFVPIRRYFSRERSNGKVRLIGIESVKQQVCDYLVVMLLDPLYEARVGFYQVASVKGKGQRLCRGALRRWVREGGYHVKLDVRKCYPSCSHEVVMRMYEKYCGSADVLYVIERLLATYTEGGLEIGSYFSLRTMQLVLSFGYHHVESLHKERRGRRKALVTHQIWHMDDILLMSNDKRDLKMAVRSLERYLGDEWGLSLKPWKVAKTSDGEPLDLGGWVVREERCTIRSGTFLRGTRAFRDFDRCPSPEHARRCSSYWGWFIHADADKVMEARHMSATFAHASKVISRQARLEASDGSHDECDTA